MTRLIKSLALGMGVLFASASYAWGDTADYLMITGSGFGSRGVMLFDPYDGTPVDPGNYFFEEFQTGGVLKHPMQVGDEIWISAQLAGQILRYDFSGNFLGDITAAGPNGEVIGNIRGMALHNDVVYLTNAAGDPGPALVAYDTDGNWLQTGEIFGSPFSVLAHNNELIVGFSGAEDLQRFDTGFNHLGPFHEGSIAWVQQTHELSSGNVMATGWSSNGLYEFDADGNQISTIAADSPRGVWELGNGNILWTNSSGVHVYDFGLGMHTTVLSGFNGQYIDSLVIPAPGAMAMLAIGGLFIRRRRRE